MHLPTGRWHRWLCNGRSGLGDRLTMAMEGNHWPGVAMMVATALLLSVAEDAFGRMLARRLKL